MKPHQRRRRDQADAAAFDRGEAAVGAAVAIVAHHEEMAFGHQHGVTIIGPVNLPSTVPYDSSSMYARTVASFLHNLISDGEFRIDLEDEVIRGALLTYQGEVVNSRVRELLGIQGAAPATTDGSGA